MKVTIIGPVYPYRGGIAHYTSLLAQALSERHQIQIVSFKRQYPAWLYPGKTDKDPSLSPLLVDALYILDPFYPWTWWQAIRAIENFQPDLVVCQWWTTFWAPAFAFISFWLRSKGIALVFLIHNVFPHEPKFWDRPLAHLALRTGETFIVQTTQEHERLLTLFPYASVVLCPHPVYDMFAAQRIPQAEARKHLDVSPNKPTVLFFGIVRPYKGLKYLIEALALLRDRGFTTQLIVAGEFWEDRKIYEAQISKLGLTEQVILDDRYIPNEELGLLFSAADLFVAPYIGGTQSGAVKMAVGFGLPVITTRSEWLTEGSEMGQCVPPADSAALAQAILDWFQNDSRPNTFSGTPHISENWAHIIAALESLISK